jgi:hypothetical protein
MNRRDIIFLLAACSVGCGIVWALHSLANTHSWESFAFMCAMMVIAIMAMARYTAVDSSAAPSKGRPQPIRHEPSSRD